MGIKTVKVIGAGSIGNHLAQASRRKGWDVTMVDVDDQALWRTRNEIYPTRYGSWDESIRLLNANAKDDNNYDLVIVGTPPDTHLNVASEALRYNPKAILIEKPATSLDLSGADDFLRKSSEYGVRLFVGYDHVVSKSVQHLSKIIKDHGTGLETIDAEFREYWGGIFAAHPWLAGPWESYLGFSERGGGALAEHSHALNLWQYLAKISGAGRVVEVQAFTTIVKNDLLEYDKISALNLKTETGVVGRCIQDVITSPPRKWVGVKYDDIQVDLDLSPTCDELRSSDGKVQNSFSKTRPDDFLTELNHIEECLSNNSESPIDFLHGLETMLIIKAAHLSAKTNRTVFIKYENGFNDRSLYVET